MSAPVQISATISAETRALLDEASRSRGLKRGHLIEEALVSYLHALRELPSDVIVPRRLALSPASSQRVAELLLDPPPPSPALAALMAGEDGDDVPT